MAGEIALLGSFGVPVSNLMLQSVVRTYVIERRQKWEALGRHDLLEKERKFPNDNPGRKWCHGFLGRHDNIEFKRASTITPAKNSVSLRDLQIFMENVITVLQDVPPENVLNCDETNIRNDFKLGKVSVIFSLILFENFFLECCFKLFICLFLFWVWFFDSVCENWNFF